MQTLSCTPLVRRINFALDGRVRSDFNDKTMPLVEINRNPSERELRHFGGIYLPIFLVLVGLICFRRLESSSLSIGLWCAAGVSLLLGWSFPKLFRGIFVGSMIVTYPIGWVVSHVILAIIYYLVFTPMGLALRLFGHDAMKKRFDPDAATYWVPHRVRSGTEHYFRQF
jgi:Saxitoxin biosynthesis operon protein SxtJ